MPDVRQRDAGSLGGPWLTDQGTAGALLGAPDLACAAAAAVAPAAAPRAEPLARPDWGALEPRGLYAKLGQRVLSLAAVACLLPPALAFALPIALANWVSFRDPRKILFVQPRVGRRGRVFRIFKFRTMSEPRRSSFDSWSGGEDQARVTPFGRFLRNAHLDELPQLINVVRGDMSLVGPRPEMVEIDAWAREHVPGFERRLALWPGLTGRAQVTQGYTGREVEAYAEKLALDLEYGARFGLAEDARILCATVLWVLRGRGWKWRAGPGAAQGVLPSKPPARS
jgi:lipopolysaccharide/colanic/teichoic acid biosynthesis glycosyltransferase